MANRRVPTAQASTTTVAASPERAGATLNGSDVGPGKMPGPTSGSNSGSISKLVRSSHRTLLPSGRKPSRPGP